MALDYILTNTGPEVQERLDQVPVTQAQLTDEIANREAADAAERDRAVGEEQRIFANFGNYYTKAEIDEMLHPTPPPIENQTIYYGFANPATFSNVSVLLSVEKSSVAGVYSVQNSTEGYMYYMVIPPDMTITRVEMDNFEFPMGQSGTMSIGGKEYKKYVSTGSDLGYLIGEYDFVVS